jgi:hypothetical protein
MPKRPIQLILDNRPGIVTSQPTSNTDTTYIYRGADIDTINNQILNLGQIPGTTSDILEASPQQLNRALDNRPYVEELNWLEGVPNLPQDFKKVPVTGGVSSNIGATRRFRGSNGLVVVMDASKTPFEQAEYTYEWMDEHPGVLTQILTTTDGEVRVPGIGLWGLLDKAVFVDKPDRYVIDHWQPENLPATNPDSLFADENEWFALESPVPITDAFEGIVSIISEDNVKVATRDSPGPLDEEPPARQTAPGLYDEILSELGNFDEPFYMLVFKGRGAEEAQFFRRSDMAFAINRTGIVEPEDVPQKFLGNRS